MSGRCTLCGAVLPERVLAGHCPECLVRVSLGEEGRLEPGGFPEEPFPRKLGDYEVLGEVARGGMGVVYRARQISLRREVALKMILSGPFASRAALERFRTEARTAASLQHPNIVAIHEVGEAEGQPYFTMDFIEGRDLASPSSAWRRSPLAGITPPKSSLGNWTVFYAINPLRPVRWAGSKGPGAGAAGTGPLRRWPCWPECWPWRYCWPW